MKGASPGEAAGTDGGLWDARGRCAGVRLPESLRLLIPLLLYPGTPLAEVRGGSDREVGTRGRKPQE